MKKGDICEGIIEKYDFPNKASFMAEDRKVTVKGALPGQKVRYMVTKKKSGMAEGKLLEVIERGAIEDAEPDCPYFGMCGGCAYQTLSYPNQLTLKEGMVKKLLDRVLLAEDSNSRDYVWEGILGSPSQTAYRNKMEFTFGDAYKDGPLALGLHKKGSFHDILSVTGCRIIGDDWSKILACSEIFFASKNVTFFHRMRHEGILRNLVIRQSHATGEFLINLVTSTQWETYGFVKEEILQAYVEQLLSLEREDDFTGRIAGILYTENDVLGDVVQSDRTIVLYGKDFIEEKLLGLTFKISPFSFFQTNTAGCEVLYQKARDYILAGSVMQGAENDKIVFDLYSGTGTIAQMMAPVAKKVIGIEIVEEAVEAAKKNAEQNGLSNCEFIAGDVLSAIDLVEDKPDVIIVDPPRDGVHPKALEKILAFGVDEMVYISCKPTSLARDLETIIKRGYQVQRVCCVDQFPRTGHVETVVLLSQRKPDDYVEVELELDEFDVTSAESKATYAEIKDYVLEKHGLKVSNLYISQIKRKCGIEVGENYNLRKATRRMDCLQADSTTAANLGKLVSQGMPKSEESKQPQCPVEKEKAIKDALEHFGMV